MATKEYAFNVKEVPMELVGNIIIPGKKVLLREDTNQFLSIVSNRYKVVPHNEVVTTFETALETMGLDFKERKINTYLPMYGSKMFRQYTFPKVISKVAVGDIVQLQLELQNSHDGTKKPGFTLRAFRLKCLNGLMVSEKVREITRKHYGSLDLNELTSNLVDTVTSFQKVTKKWIEWKSEKIAVIEAEDYLSKASIPQKINEAIVAKFEDEEKNKWGLFQAATYVITHGVKARKDIANSRLNQLFLEEQLSKNVFYR